MDTYLDKFGALIAEEREGFLQSKYWNLLGVKGQDHNIDISDQSMSLNLNIAIAKLYYPASTNKETLASGQLFIWYNWFYLVR